MKIQAVIASPSLLSTAGVFLLSPFFSSVTLTSSSLPLPLQVALQQQLLHQPDWLCDEERGRDPFYALQLSVLCFSTEAELPDPSETRLDATVLSFLPLSCDPFLTLTESRQRSGGVLCHLWTAVLHLVPQNPPTNTGVPHQLLLSSRGNTTLLLRSPTNLNVCLRLFWSRGSKKTADDTQNYTQMVRKIQQSLTIVINLP